MQARRFLSRKHVNLKFFSKNKQQRGGDEVSKGEWEISYIAEATPESLQEIEEKEENSKALHGLRPEIMRGLPTKVLHELRRVIDQHEKEGKADT